jgi:hypothetical protein
MHMTAHARWRRIALKSLVVVTAAFSDLPGQSLHALVPSRDTGLSTTSSRQAVVTFSTNCDTASIALKVGGELGPMDGAGDCMGTSGPCHKPPRY